MVMPKRDVSASSLSAISISTNGSATDPFTNVGEPEQHGDSPASRLSDTLPMRPDRRASHFAGQRRRESTSLRDLYEMSGISLDFDEDEGEGVGDEEDQTSTSIDMENSLQNYKGGDSAIMGECSIATFEETS